MGDRAQVRMVESGVWLYTHWQGHGLPNVVQSALAREARWNDYEYLTRIIFDEMVGDDQGSETGYGIGMNKHGDVYRVIDVDTETQTVTMRYVPIRGDGGDSKSWSFEDYVELRDPSWDIVGGW